MFNDPNFRKNLLVSIITSVLVIIFIEPLLKLSANGIMWLGENISASFTKSVYTSAALGFREKFSFIQLSIFFAAVIGFIAGVESSKILKTKIVIQKEVAKSQIRKILSACLASLTILIVIYLMAGNFIELQLNTSFNQRLSVLSAKITDQQVKDLRAAWALMENRSDYEKLTTEMNSLAQEHHIKLPLALWQ